MAYLLTLFAGALFGAGLIVSGMSSPKKVLDFLDVAAIASGNWDPTLLMVFAGALPVMFVAYQRVGVKPFAADRYDIPTATAVDAPLVAGSVLFGLGWGLVGFCPGPAVVALAVASQSVFAAVLAFFGAMLLGVWVAMVTRGLWGSAARDVPV